MKHEMPTEDEADFTQSQIEAERMTNTLVEMLELSKEDRDFVLGFAYGLVASRHRDTIDKAQLDRLRSLREKAKKAYFRRAAKKQKQPQNDQSD